MKILYLDQNKWIELARGVKSPDNFPSQYAVVETLVREAKAGNIVIPLTFASSTKHRKLVTSNDESIWRGCNLRLAKAKYSVEGMND